jgi:hypothetical protein
MLDAIDAARDRERVIHHRRSPLDKRLGNTLSRSFILGTKTHRDAESSGYLALYTTAIVKSTTSPCERT